MNRIQEITVAFTLFCCLGGAQAEDLTAPLPAEQLRKISRAVDLGLDWLAAEQNTDGSFNGLRDGGEGPCSVETCQALLAFLARGHQPGRGRHGRQMSKAIGWLLQTQRPDGSFSTRPPAQWPADAEHPLTCLTLSEVFGVCTAEQTEPVGQAIKKALAVTRRVQESPKRHTIFRGGWGYDSPKDQLAYRRRLATLTHTSRNLAFLRSAHNAGFEVPEAWIDQGLEYVVRCYQPGPHNENFRRLPVNAGQAVFRTRPVLPRGLSKQDFGIPNSGRYPYNWTNFNSTAGGILALAWHGRRDDPMVRSAGDWLGEHSIPRQGTSYDFYYGCYISSEAMSQIGGEHWARFFPRVVDRLVSHQGPDGPFRQDAPLYRLRNRIYCTGLAVLTLTIPDQLLPIHQR